MDARAQDGTSSGHHARPRTLQLPRHWSNAFDIPRHELIPTLNEMKRILFSDLWQNTGELSSTQGEIEAAVLNEEPQTRSRSTTDSRESSASKSPAPSGKSPAPRGVTDLELKRKVETEEETNSATKRPRIGLHPKSPHSGHSTPRLGSPAPGVVVPASNNNVPDKPVSSPAPAGAPSLEKQVKSPLIRTALPKSPTRRPMSPKPASAESKQAAATTEARQRKISSTAMESKKETPLASTATKPKPAKPQPQPQPTGPTMKESVNELKSLLLKMIKADAKSYNEADILSKLSQIEATVSYTKEQKKGLTTSLLTVAKGMRRKGVIERLEQMKRSLL
ncbi:uncharacterized protein VTP21DRAFT_925 [Calcarisporiella thermophila]|uniref:uncharacterized protein n=1 Tax=Calcarisporiella thermophila TaxID=911321 RepID=UPI003742E773